MEKLDISLNKVVIIKICLCSLYCCIVLKFVGKVSSVVYHFWMLDVGSHPQNNILFQSHRDKYINVTVLILTTRL